MAPSHLATLVHHHGLPAPGPERLAAFEALIGARLPDDYRAFLALTPGGPLRRPMTFSLAGEAVGAEHLGHVAGLGSEPDCSLEAAFHEAEVRGTPEGLIVIMTDGGGNDLALAVRPDRLGEVFFLNHEAAEPDGRITLEAAEDPERDYALRLAASFTALVAGFTTPAG